MKGPIESRKDVMLYFELKTITSATRLEIGERGEKVNYNSQSNGIKEGRYCNRKKMVDCD